MSGATNTNGKFRTNDMVLATLLFMDGCEYEHELEVIRRADGTSVKNCTWVFVAPEDGEDKREFDKIVSRFLADKCKVEPREFARTWADVRSQMFQFLNRDRSHSR